MQSRQPRPNPAREEQATRFAAALPALALLFAGALVPQEPERVTETLGTLDRYLETRRILSDEQAEWKVGKRLLKDQVALVQSQLQQLHQSIEASKTDIVEADEELSKLRKEHEALVATTESLTLAVGDIENRVKRILPRLPAPLREQVMPFSQRLPEDPETTEEGLGSRYSSVMGVLLGLNKFNRNVHAFNERVEVAEGETLEVQTLYFGVGHGYYVSVDATKAGLGVSTDDGWAWTPANEHGEAIRNAIAVFQNEDPAAFVQLPVRVQ